MKPKPSLFRTYKLRERPVQVQVEAISLDPQGGVLVEFMYPGKKYSQVHLRFLLNDKTAEALLRGLSSILQPKRGNHSG